MSCAKVTARVFPMVVNTKDINKYRRITMSEDSPRDSDAESLSESTNREASVKYEMNSSLSEMKLNKGSQTDIMMYPPQYPAPSPPSQLPKRKVRKIENTDDDPCDTIETELSVSQCMCKCENCPSVCASSTNLDATVCNEPDPGAARSNENRNDRQQNEEEDVSCAMECLYYAVQCSDCILL